jgi:methanogenic corrinoid protein MtbC1
LYSEGDVTRLALLKRATTSGHSIGEIARLDVAALEALLHGPTAERGASADDAFIEDALGATARLDSAALETVLKRAALGRGVDRFVDGVVGRFLTAVGSRWHEGSLSPAHEHLASDTVRRVLAWISEAYAVAPNAPTVVVATPAGEMHELGAMAVAAAAVGAGWRVVYLGANLPGKDIARAASQVGASVVALSIVYADSDEVGRQIVDAANGAPEGTSVVIGGAGADGVREQVAGAGVRVLPSIDALRRMLTAADTSRFSARAATVG